MPESINPATEAKLAEYETMTGEAIDAVLVRTNEAARRWAARTPEKRAGYAAVAADVLEKRKSELASLMTREMGKPISQSKAEIDKCAWVCRYYAENGPRFLADEAVESDAGESFLAFEPLGVVLAVMPWNFPFWQVFRFAAPGLTAGNGALLKHASNVTGCALAIESVFRDAGYPEDLFRTLVAGSDAIAKVIADDRVRGVTLTGSESAGRAVAAEAGEALKKTVLELGGSDPYLILADADLDVAAETCAHSRLINGGQSCIAAKRFIVDQSVLRPFTEKLVAAMKAYATGDPEDPDTAVGPQAREDLRDELHDQVRRSVDAGAEILLGGEMPGGPGWFYPPSVLAGVRPGMAAFDEETFGPVAAIVEAENEDDAVRLANQSSFGLGAAVFSRDVSRAKALARRIESGCVFVNDFVKSDPRLPFGGVKNSGYGRELSKLGIREFVNIKTISVA